MSRNKRRLPLNKQVEVPEKQAKDDWRNHPASNGRKHKGSQWVKGQSGNPRGRKSARNMADELDIQALARQHTRPALRCLVDITKDKTAPPAARANAASTLLDRGYGRAPQTITHRGELESAILGLITGLDTKAQPDQEDSEGQTIQ